MAAAAPPTPMAGEVRILHAEEAAARRLAVRLLRTRLKLARLLHELDRHRHFAAVGCASVVELARTLGIDGLEANLLRRVGAALAREPRLRARILAGQVDLPTAALIGELHVTPGAVRPGERWSERAAEEPPQAFRREARARIEQARQGAAAVVPLTVHVRPRVREDFDRARIVASRRARDVQSPGQVFGALVEHYLDSFDPLRLPPIQRRPSRKPPKPDSRSIAPAVAQAVRARANDHCEVDGCRHSIFLQFGHLKAHRAGGGRDVDDLLLLCAAHHKAFDAGQLTFDGWDEAKRPRFLLHDERPPGFPGADAGGPPTRAPPAEAARPIGAGDEGGV